MAYDFGGWATVNDVKCSDGRTIKKGAFAHMDGKRVPLIWNHQHDDPSCVLGYCDLEHRDNGVYAKGCFNNTEKANEVKEQLQHGDLTSLSIYANHLKQNGMDVVHGAIREVSLVLAGANPGAFIDHVSFAHSDVYSEEEGVIYCGEDELELSHADKDDEEPESDEEEKKDAAPKKKKAESDTEEPEEEQDEKSEDEDEEIEHADEEKDQSLEEVLDGMTDIQKQVVNFVAGEAYEKGKKEKNNNNDDSEGGKEEMKHNIFAATSADDVMQHNEEGLKNIIGMAKSGKASLKDTFLAHADEYGIKNIEYLFPDYKNVTDTPGFIKRNPDEWVGIVMGGVHHTPFSRIKMLFADITADEARAKGYTKGNKKVEEVFELLKRTVDPTTIYKKQKLDRDDIVDITDFNIVSWLKTEMRMMLDEEIARAIIFGDGRSAMSNDKIKESNIIPIIKDDDLYTIKHVVKAVSGESIYVTLVDEAVVAQDDYEGSGNTIAFMPQSVVTRMLLIKDADGHRMYKNLQDLALAMNVNRVVKVPNGIVPEGTYGVIVDLKDYNIGADKGGSINMFEDFDIDYNQEKYLMETRCSGALVKPHSAIVLKAEEVKG